MKFKSPLLAVSDLARSKRFYHEVLGLEVVTDFGANVVLSGGVALQTKVSWTTLLQKQESEIQTGGNASELYFEEDAFDEFVQKLNTLKEINFVHPILEHSWGQRVARFYDPDGHIIEVGENLTAVVRRFLNGGLSAEQTAARMDVPVDYVESCKNSIKYVHTNVIAKDWRALAAFYIDVFGCTPLYPERDLSGEWIDRLTGIRDVKVMGIHLSLPGYEGGPTLEIFAYEPNRNRRQDSPINEPGFAHIAFLVDDVEATLSHLLAHGGKQYGELVIRDYEALGELTVVYATDPEGNCIEIQNWKK